MKPHTTLRAELRLYRGAPTIHVNGVPLHGGFVGIRGGSHFLQARPEGVALLWQMVFVGPGGEIDWEDALVKEMDDLFAAQPQAFGAVVLGLRPTRAWVAAHPDEMPVAAWPIDWLTDSRPDASWASETWRRDSVAAVEQVARRLRAEFDGRVILYQVGAGRCGENGPQIHIDFSEPMLRHFRSWLRKRYRDDESMLRHRWSDPSVTFDTATPPDDVERLHTEWFSLRSPLRRRTADYFAACAECVERNARLWGEAVKRATDGGSLYATPGASVMDVGLHYDAHGHLPKNSARAYLDAPCIDMVVSPASYAYRDLGRGDSTTLQPMGSVQLAGKMQLRDFDERTHLTAWKGEEFPKCRLWQPPADAWGDIQLLLRCTAYSLMKNGAFWWHELEKGMFRLPEHIECARRLQSVGRGAVLADRRMAENGLAVFVHTPSNFLIASSNRMIFEMNYEARQLQWAHAGMASNVFRVEDAGHPDMPPPKVIMVTNGFAMTTEQADSVKTLARKHRATLVWLMAPGVQTPSGFDLEHTRRITGFKVCALDVETLPRITMKPGCASRRGSTLGQTSGGLAEPAAEDGAHPWSRVTWPDERPVSSFGGGPFDYDDGGARGMGPTFFVDVDDDPGAVVLGELDAINKPGLVVREMDGYTAVYCAAPYLHKALLRRIGRDGGAHGYLDTDDLVHATRELVVANARRAGRKEFRWPSRVEIVLDLYSGETVAENVDSWSLDMRKYETRFFFAGATDVAARIRSAMADERKGVDMLE